MDTKAIVIADGRELLVSDIKPQLEEMARKLLKLTPNGKRLDVGQATDLAVFSLINRLNPFEGESYYMDKVGPTAGVAGYRRKTNEYLMERYGPQATYFLEYVAATTLEADFNPDKGDVAWKVILHDSEMERRWMGQIIENLAGLKGAGYTGDDAYQIAREMAGPRPCVEAVGVVHANEKFTYDGGVEKWDRNERAKKRGEKQVLRRAYPVGVRIVGDAEMGEVIDGVARDVAMDVASQIAAGPKRPEGMTNDDIIASMGFPPDPKPITVTQPVPGLTLIDLGPPEPEYVPLEPADTHLPPPSPITPQQAAVDAGACPDIYQANAWYDRGKGWCNKNDPEAFVKWAKVVQGWMDTTGCDLEQAVGKANKGEKP